MCSGFPCMITLICTIQTIWRGQIVWKRNNHTANGTLFFVKERRRHHSHKSDTGKFCSVNPTHLDSSMLTAAWVPPVVEGTSSTLNWGTPPGKLPQSPHQLMHHLPSTHKHSLVGMKIMLVNNNCTDRGQNDLYQDDEEHWSLRHTFLDANEERLVIIFQSHLQVLRSK